MALRTTSQSGPAERSGIFCCSMMSASCCRTSFAFRSTAAAHLRRSGLFSAWHPCSELPMSLEWIYVSKADFQVKFWELQQLPVTNVQRNS